MSKLIAATSLATLLVGAASAQAADVNSAIDKVVACIDIADPNERVACYDRNVAVLDYIRGASEPVAAATSAPAAPAVAATSAKPATAAPAPTDSAPSWAKAPEANTPEVQRQRAAEPDEFTITIVRVDGKFIKRFYTDDGQVWEQLLKDDNLDFPEETPFEATIIKKSFGKPVIQFPGLKRTWKVKRIE